MESLAKSIGCKKVIAALLASVTLVGGAMIYVCFRPTHLLLFKWIDRFGLLDFAYRLRLNLKDIPEWVVYSLPDGLWTFSYCLFIGTIWNFNLKKSFFFLVILPVFAVANEIMQYFHIVSGTFDWMDVMAFLIAFTLGLFYIDNVRQKEMNH